MYKIEPHLHTKHTSKCGWMTAQELIDGYKAAGYDAIIVTDHYNRITFDYLGVDTTAPGSRKSSPSHSRTTGVTQANIPRLRTKPRT